MYVVHMYVYYYYYYYYYYYVRTSPKCHLCMYIHSIQYSTNVIFTSCVEVFISEIFHIVVLRISFILLHKWPIQSIKSTHTVCMYGTFHNKVNDIAHSTGGQRGDSRRLGTRWRFDSQWKPLDSHHYVKFTLV